LGIYYDDEQVLLSDTEIFSLDKLQQWGLKNLMLSETDTAALQKRLVKKGELPLKNMAGVTLHRVEELVEPVRALYIACTRNANEQSILFELPICDSLLKGTIKGVFDGNMVVLSWSKNETKYLVEAYVRYLSGIAAGVLSGAYFISGGNREAMYKASPLSVEEAKRRLAELVSIYKGGFEKIAPFYPDFDTKPDEVAELDPVKFLKLVDKKLNNSQFPCEDLYILSEYRNGYYKSEGILEAYKAICQHILVPLPEVFPGYYDY
jgi:exodeoxyribonuclease V gamma subunit